MKTRINEVLNPSEVAFVEKVFANPGGKMSTQEAYELVDDNTIMGAHVALWKTPEALGMIESVGSFKWIPKNLSAELYFDSGQ